MLVNLDKQEEILLRLIDGVHHIAVAEGIGLGTVADHHMILLKGEKILVGIGWDAAQSPACKKVEIGDSGKQHLKRHPDTQYRDDHIPEPIAAGGIGDAADAPDGYGGEDDTGGSIAAPGEKILPPPPNPGRHFLKGPKIFQGVGRPACKLHWFLLTKTPCSVTQQSRANKKSVVPTAFGENSPHLGSR